MKYLITTICAIALAAALTSCKNDEGTKPAPATQAAAAITPAPPVTPAPSVTPGPQSKPAEDLDFRGTKWGMSMEEVKKIELKKPEVETDDSLTYTGRFKNLLTYYNFKFKDDKLYRAGVVYSTKQKSAADYMNTYQDTMKEIIAAYGEPVIDGEQKTSPDAVIDPDKKAEAVCKGDLMMAAQWNLPRSIVVLMMRGNGTDCLISLIYLDENAVHSTAGQDGEGVLDIKP